MLREAFEFLTNLGRQTVPDVVTSKAEPDHVYFLRGSDGKLVRTVAEAPPACHTADNLASVVDLAKLNEKTAAVWVRPFAVRITFGDQARSRGTLTLSMSEPLATLAEFAKSKPQLQQAAVLGLLRTTFYGMTPGQPDLTAILRKVRFNVNQTTVGEVSQGKASLGKTIEGEVFGTAAIPERVTFSVPVYAQPFMSKTWAHVICALDPDPNTGMFRVIPHAGQMEQAYEAGLEALAGTLKEALPPSVPIYFGSPDRS